MRGGKNLMTSLLEDAPMLSLCFRNLTLERSVNFILTEGCGSKAPHKPQRPSCSPLPSSPLSLGSRGQRVGPRDHHSDSGVQTLSSFRVQTEDSKGALPTSTEHRGKLG